MEFGIRNSEFEIRDSEFEIQNLKEKRPRGDAGAEINDPCVGYMMAYIGAFSPERMAAPRAATVGRARYAKWIAVCTLLW